MGEVQDTERWAVNMYTKSEVPQQRNEFDCGEAGSWRSHPHRLQTFNCPIISRSFHAVLRARDRAGGGVLLHAGRRALLPPTIRSRPCNFRECAMLIGPECQCSSLSSTKLRLKAEGLQDLPPSGGGPQNESERSGKALGCFV